jgi:hypothetical protein
MKWLHFSDLHRIIDQIQGESALILDMLPEYLTEQKITADYLFFTGDFRYAKTQTAFSDNEVAEKVAHTIKRSLPLLV